MGCTFHLRSFHMSFSFPETTFPFSHLSKSYLLFITKQNALLTLKSRVTVPAKSDFPSSALLPLSVYTIMSSLVHVDFIGLMDQMSAYSVSGHGDMYITTLSIILTPVCRVKHHYWWRSWFVQGHTAGKGGARLSTPSVSLHSLGTTHASSCFAHNSWLFYAFPWVRRGPGPYVAWFQGNLDLLIMCSWYVT